MTRQASPILSVWKLKKYFPITKGIFSKQSGSVRAVDDISFDVYRGQSFGLVGESGCGKTTLGRCILRAIEPTSGKVVYSINGQTIDFTGLEAKALKDMRRHVQLIFQDPYSSLNARMIIKDIIAEPLVVNKTCPKSEIENRVGELLKKVGLLPEYMYKYPHAFSGGQRQRVGIARALALNPNFVVCDEPVSALDVSVQAQVLNLLSDLKEELNLSYLFISHDLSVVRHICDRVAVMYVGRMVEVADTDDLFAAPRHPYTEALMSSIPVPDPRFRSQKILLSGEVADPSNPPPGCAFHPRCCYVQEICRERTPELRAVAGSNTLVACHLHGELSLRGF